MTTHNPENERTKRRYFAYLQEAKRYSEPTVDSVAKALARFEEYTKYREFRQFHPDQAIGFKRRLAEQRNQQSGEKLSKATLHHTLAHLKAFFHWLAGQPGFKSRMQYSDADYFNLSEKEVRVATAKREQTGPTMPQARHAIATMPADSPIQRRNQALVAFTLLTGARDSAMASMKLKHVDMPERRVVQDAREVKTKFSKTFTTFFFPVGGDVEQIVAEWVRYLREDLLWGVEDPLFPATLVAVGPSRQFEAVGLARVHWSSAASIRGIFKAAFANAGLPYFNPHSFRNTLVRLGQTMCQSPEAFKAWSQNLGHEKVMTTFLSYGQVEGQRQGEIIKGLGSPRNASQPDAEGLEEVLERALRQVRGGAAAS